MTIFSPDGHLAYVCSSFVAETDVFDTHTRQVAGKVVQRSPFCPNIAASPDGTQVWLTLKDTGKVLVFGAAVYDPEDDRHRADHQPRQFRERAGRSVRLHQHRWAE
jgi:DNA-binding beta-propeller fold protein YncE